MKAAFIGKCALVALSGVVVLGGLRTAANAATDPDFTVSVSPSSQTVQQGSPTKYTVTLTSVRGFANSVSDRLTTSILVRSK